MTQNHLALVAFLAAFGFETFLAAFLAIFLVFGALVAFLAFGALAFGALVFLAALAGDLAGDEVATGAGVEAATGAGVAALALLTFGLADLAVLVLGVDFEADLF